METKGYKLTVGLEVHAELKTATKMFCKSRNDSDETKPNQNICPVCMAHPGTLPVINKEAVHLVLKVGTALGSDLADYTEFDRKNYFYPDLPKGYQISQYEYPLVSGGSLNGFEITRIHLEEDTARSQHDATNGNTIIDYNRAGVPLMELVTEPVMHSPEDVGNFARELRLLLRSLGASDANMEKGEMRLEANISVSKGDTLGTKVEVKNINSIRAAERAVAYEFNRQIECLERGESIDQETRGWDEMAQKTFSQRVKEGSADYRYFPDPDLPSLNISEFPEFSKDSLEKELPVLPWELREKYTNLGVSTDDVEMYVRDEVFGKFFDSVVKDLEESGDTELIKTASNYITTDLAKIIRDVSPGEVVSNQDIVMPATSFTEIIRMASSGEISSRGAKDILAIVALEGGSPRELAKERGLMQQGNEEELMKFVEQVISENSEAVEEYKAGKDKAIQFLVGQGMKITKGSANPEILRELFVSSIKK